MFEGAFMPTHWLVILLIVMIFFGAGKLPNVMKDLGAGVKEFKRAQRDEDTTPAGTPAGAPERAPAPLTGMATTNGTIHAAEQSPRA